MAAGLSSGEWTALHVAGVVSFEDTLKVLEARGRFMQDACQERPGGMLTIIGADEATLDKLCAGAASRRPTSIPRADGVERAEGGHRPGRGAGQGAGHPQGHPPERGGAFHSTLMRPAAIKLEAELGRITFHAPRFPVVSNVTAAPHTTPDEIRKLMVAQVYSSVRWYQGIEWMKGQGVNSYLECGPGKVLTGLVKRIDKTAQLHSIQDRSGMGVPAA
jgi:[acyl-carrier-protein] S-malonyltransferase